MDVNGYRKLFRKEVSNAKRRKGVELEQNKGWKCEISTMRG